MKPTIQEKRESEVLAKGSEAQQRSTTKALKVRFRTIEVPLYSRVVNFGIRQFETTASLIDRIEPIDREWGKVDVLCNDLDYLSYLRALTGSDIGTTAKVLNEFKDDVSFRNVFSRNLSELDRSGINDPGDLRFHSLTVYAVVRLVKPRLMVETGVAHGKSSAMALLAMHHNKRGRLISIDLPNPTGAVLADGSKTTTGSFEVGWLVPDYLRRRWSLTLGDSRKFLPSMVRKHRPDLFMHDSLHTYDHTTFEFETVLRTMKSGVLLCDNIDMESGQAFEQMLRRRGLIGFAYRDFAGTRLLR